MYSNTYNQQKLHRAPQWTPQPTLRRPPLTPPPPATTMIPPPDPISYHSGPHGHSSPHHYQQLQQHHHSHSQNHGPATPYAPQPTTSSALNRILNPSTPPSSHSVPITTAWPAPSRKWEAGRSMSRIRSVVLPSVEDEDNGEGSFIGGVPGHNHSNGHEYGLSYSHSHGVHRPVPMSTRTYHPQQIPPSPSETHRYPPYQQQQQPFISSSHHHHHHHQPPSLPPPPTPIPYVHPTTHSLPILISSPYSHPQQQQQQQQQQQPSSPLITHPKYPNMPPHYIDPTTLPLSPTQPSASRPAKRPHRPSHSSDRDREYPRKTILRGGDADDDDEEEAPDNWGGDGGLGWGDRRERRRTDYETRQDKEQREASRGVLLDPSLLLRYSEAMGDSNAHTRLQCLRMAAGLRPRPRGTAR